MNLRNIVASIIMMSAVLSNSVSVAGVPIINIELEKIAAVTVVGSAGAGIGIVLGAQKGAEFGAVLGMLAGPAGALVGGTIGVVAGGATGYVGLVVVKALHNEMNRR